MASHCARAPPLHALPMLIDIDSRVYSFVLTAAFAWVPQEEEKEKVKDEVRKEILSLDPTAEGIDDPTLTEDQLREKLIDAQVATGTAFWQSWWFPERLRGFIEGVYYGGSAWEEGTLDPRASTGPWLTLLAQTIKRSGSISFGSADAGMPKETNVS